MAKRPRNPFKKILRNAKGGQDLNKMHQGLGINRKVKIINCTFEDIERLYNEQNGISKWFELEMDLMGVFESYNLMAPSLDRLDNDKDYTPDNICLSTRLENYAFNQSNTQVKIALTKKIEDNVLKKYNIHNGENDDRTIPMGGEISSTND